MGGGKTAQQNESGYRKGGEIMNGKPLSGVKLGQDIGSIQSNDKDILMKLLCNEIVVKAIQDWKALARGTKKETTDCNFQELRNFFLKDWCDLLLSQTNFTAEFVLEQLEEYKLEEEKRKKERKRMK